ncbi:MAG: hypothetical protein PHY45_13335 [Rhodocyclaceae bacterium]|nr:hypothetical protein [Rhodocyclaceae bacterium]
MNRDQYLSKRQWHHDKFAGVRGARAAERGAAGRANASAGAPAGLAPLEAARALQGDELQDAPQQRAAKR